MDLTRKQVIEILEKADSTVYKEPKTKTAQALEYAISSLKTDEAYQIMYEGGEIFTKDEVAAKLKDLKSEIKKLKSYESADGQDLVMLADIGILFQQKINALKGDHT